MAVTVQWWANLYKPGATWDCTASSERHAKVLCMETGARIVLYKGRTEPRG